MQKAEKEKQEAAALAKDSPSKEAPVEGAAAEKKKDEPEEEKRP